MYKSVCVTCPCICIFSHRTLLGFTSFDMVIPARWWSPCHQLCPQTGCDAAVRFDSHGKKNMGHYAQTKTHEHVMVLVTWDSFLLRLAVCTCSMYSKLPPQEPQQEPPHSRGLQRDRASPSHSSLSPILSSLSALWWQVRDWHVVRTPNSIQCASSSSSWPASA